MGLRSEVFAKDAVKFNNTEEALRTELTPFNVATHNCVIELLQPKGRNKYAVFVVKESEAITYSYERNSQDPRITHNLNVKLDEYGNVLESAAVVYPRLVVDASLPSETQQEQSRTVLIYTKNHFTNDVVSDEAYRLKLPSEIKTFELKGVAKSGTYYTPSDFADILSDTLSETALYHEIEKPLIAGKAQKRLIEHIRSIYYDDNLNEPLNLHELQSLAIHFESYQLAYTPELVTDIFDTRVDLALLTEKGKFIHSENDNNWWIRSGTVQYLRVGESAVDARKRFIVPISYTDPFGAKTEVNYYESPISHEAYNLLIEETEDALGNKSKVDKFNFRTLSPQRLKDINGNLSEAIVDELGLVKAIAVMGKGNQADDLTGINEFTDAAEISLVNSFFNTPKTPEGITDSVSLANKGKQLLNHATARFVYDFDVYKNTGKPTVVSSIIRENHFLKEDGTPNNESPVQLSFEYSNGLGEVVMKKVQAEPGRAKQVIVNADNTTTVNEIDTDALTPRQLRWIGNGRTIKNNKGNAVKQYEPYFSVNNLYEDFKELVETGVTPLMFYDAAGRVTKTEMPDGTFSKVEFDSWKQSVYDANDTVRESEWFDRRTDINHPKFITDTKEQQAAAKAVEHADTPNILHFDTLGRPILSVEHNRNILTDADEFYRTKVKLDVEGNLRSVIDAREIPENANKGNTVMQYKYDMLGNLVYQNSMDAGQRWLLMNISGNPLRTWDERNHDFQYFYDILQRPTHSKVFKNVGVNSLENLDNIFERIIYGESLLTGTRTDTDRFNEVELQKINVLGQPIKIFDTGGLIETPEYDFKGQPVSTTRNLFKKYKEVANWIDANLEIDLEGEPFTFTTETDALGRITKQTVPDQSIITPSYNEAGLLNSETVKHQGAGDPIPYIKNIDYNEKGQREKIVYGNDVATKFSYDKKTFRLKQLESKKQNNEILQNLHYTYDPVGNITAIEDKAIPIQFFANSIIEPLSEYTYDALYRLVEATGRENNTALTFGDCDNWNDASFMKLQNPGDPMAIRNYTQSYLYDAVGNIKRMKHVAAGGNWTRRYEYEKNNNRLISTHIGDNGNAANYTKYSHHTKHGFLEELPHLEKIEWNFKEEVVLTIQQHCTEDNVPIKTYYQYDGNGQRIRKITENQAIAGVSPTKKEERIYLAGYELYKKHSGADAGLQRVSLSLMDEGHRFVMIETRNNVDDGTVQQLTRYQLHNHLGSASLELDNSAQVISYEEYHPYGTTAYQAKNKTIKAIAKRYRYTGMERDEETGLEYHNARYYLPWLGRWLSADPIGVGDGLNQYCYARSSPINLKDINGNYSWGEFFDDVGSGIKSAAKGIIEPALIVMDFGQMGAALVTQAVTGEPQDVDFLSATGNYIKNNPDDSFAEMVFHSAIEPNLNIVTGGGYGTGKNIVAAVESGNPEEARRILVRGAAGQLFATGLATGSSRISGSGWTGRGSNVGDQALIDSMISNIN